MTDSLQSAIDLINTQKRKAEEKAARLEAEKSELPSLPSLAELCLKRPLYDSFKTSNTVYLSNMRTQQTQFDAYCVECKADSIFKDKVSRGGGAGTTLPDDWMLQNSAFDIVVFCQRANHRYTFCFEYKNGSLTKYGQSPSLEDIAGHDIRKYAPLLRDGYFGELKKATGLASHGIGIGSFVYLRRIFEKLIHDHHQELVNQGCPVEDFENLRMADKIGALKNVLPPALVRNKATYGILSSGIHALDEDTCRKYFPVVRAAIIEILEQDLRAREEAKAADALEKEISKLAAEVKAGPAEPPA